MKNIMIVLASLVFLAGCAKETETVKVEGKAGATGQTGTKGDTGNAGVAGLTGSQGFKGDKGETGSVGAQGSKGDKGLTGATGLQGQVGSAGAAGNNGANAVIKQYAATKDICPNGGLIIDTFTDINGSNTYESDIDTNYQRTKLCSIVVKSDDNCNKDKDDNSDCNNGDGNDGTSNE